MGEDFWVRADLARVERALACGADVNAKNDHGGTPLHYAAYRNDNSAVIEALLEAGADVNAKNDDGNTPLHWGGVQRKRGSDRGVAERRCRRICEERRW